MRSEPHGFATTQSPRRTLLFLLVTRQLRITAEGSTAHGVAALKDESV